MPDCLALLLSPVGDVSSLTPVRFALYEGQIGNLTPEPQMSARQRIASVIVTLSTSMSAAAAQTPADTNRSTCPAYLEGFQSKIAANYGGFPLEVRGARREAYERFTRDLRTRAARTRFDDCFPVLDTLIQWFEDPHLFVFQYRTLDSATAARVRNAVTHHAVSEPSIRDALRRRGPALDPIEGIWTDGRLRVAITRSAPGRFDAVVLTPDSGSWHVGDVRGTLTRRPSDYRAEWYEPDYSSRVLTGRVYRGVTLRLSPLLLVREYPVKPEDMGLADVRDPRRPTLQLRAGTVIVSIPSHSPQYKPVLDSLVGTAAAELRSVDHLIVDLRGNEGGSSYMSDTLLPYIMTRERKTERYPERGGAVMLSSPDQIRYAQRAFGSDTTRFVRTLIQRMQDNPGRFVPFTEPGESRPETFPDSLIYGPKRVAVMVDRGTVSASEVLVLKALRSNRAVVIGEPTEGALDYQSTSIVRVFPGAERWYLGYPTITRDTLLPLDGMRGKGIAPQVRVGWDTIPDPITWVDNWLRRSAP